MKLKLNKNRFCCENPSIFETNLKIISILFFQKHLIDCEKCEM